MSLGGLHPPNSTGESTYLNNCPRFVFKRITPRFDKYTHQDVPSAVATTGRSHTVPNNPKDGLINLSPGGGGGRADPGPAHGLINLFSWGVRGAEPPVNAGEGSGGAGRCSGICCKCFLQKNSRIENAVPWILISKAPNSDTTQQGQAAQCARTLCFEVARMRTLGSNRHVPCQLKGPRMR